MLLDGLEDDDIGSWPRFLPKGIHRMLEVTGRLAALAGEAVEVAVEFFYTHPVWASPEIQGQCSQ